MADDTLSIDIGAEDMTGPAFAALNKSLSGIPDAMQKVVDSGKKAEGVGESIKKAFDAFKATAYGTVAVMAANELLKFHHATLASVAGLADLAEQQNMTATQFQAIAYAADTVGIKQEALTGSLSRYRTKVGDALNGNKEAISSFATLGIKLLDANGKARDSGTILTEVAAAILKMGSADQQAAAAKDMLGLSGSRMVPLLKLLAQGMGELERTASAAGVMIDEKTVAAANRLENQSKRTELAARAFYAQIGVEIELKYLQALEKTLNGITGAYRQAQAEAKELQRSAPERALQADASVLKDSLAAAEQRLKVNPNNKMAQAEVDGLKRRLAETEPKIVAAQMQRGQADTNAADLQRLTEDGLPARNGGARQPDVVTPGGGGGGGDKRDRIQEAINQLEAQAGAAQKALRTMLQGSTLPLKDVEEAVAVEKKITEEIAKLSKYEQADPAKVARIKDLVRADQEAESQLRKYSQASRDAVEIERRAGDGKQFLREETQRLNEAMGTGRLSQEAYTEALRLATEKARDMNLQLIGQQGGIAGLVAGMEYAASQWERNNRVFQVGGRIYDQVIGDMVSLTTSFGDSFEQTALRIAQSWAKMLADMGMRAAASQVFQAVGGFGGILSFLGLGGQSNGMTTLSPGATMDAFWAQGTSLADIVPGLGGAFAEGGRPPVGLPSWVGEGGKELFVPDQAGTIYNQDQLAGMGGGQPIVVNLTQNLSVGEFVTPTQLAQATRAAQDGAMAGILKLQSSGDVRMRQAGF